MYYIALCVVFTKVGLNINDHVELMHVLPHSMPDEVDSASA